MKYLDENENFKFGEYRGEELSEVAAEDPKYIERLLKGDIEFEERELLSNAIGVEVQEDA